MENKLESLGRNYSEKAYNKIKNKIKVLDHKIDVFYGIDRHTNISMNPNLTSKEKVRTKALFFEIERNKNTMSKKQLDFMANLVAGQLGNISFQNKKNSKQFLKRFEQFNKVVSVKLCSKCNAICCEIPNSKDKCFFLSKDNKCKIYKIRPNTCKRFVCDQLSDKQVKKFFKNDEINIVNLGDKHKNV